MKKDKLKIISAKDLGRLNMPDFCPCCFWLERHVDKPPAVFPGIFSTLDAITKRSVNRSFNNQECLPGWLPIKGLVGVEEGDTYFKYPTEYGDWILTGCPDDIFQRDDGSYHIVDYKTAKFTARQDELFPIYHVQLNCYAYLAEKYDYKPVSKLSLIYCQPNEDLENDDYFQLGFKIYLLDADLDQDIIPKLLIKAREILNQDKPPLAKENCRGICQWIDRVFRKIKE